MLSFDKTRTLWPCGTLLFVAKLDILLARYAGRISCNYPIDPVVHELFEHIGVLRLLGNSSQVSVNADNVKDWYLVKGNDTDTSGFTQLFTQYQSEMPFGVSQGLYEGMSEAVTNVVQHAYEGKLVPDSRKGWWVFAQQKDDRLVVVVCDLGIGIPKSLNRKFPETVRASLVHRKRKDSWFLALALKEGRTRTELLNRGKGLQDMLSFVKSADVGMFSIYSLAGSFIYGREGDVQRKYDFQIPVPGTIVQWSVPLTRFVCLEKPSGKGVAQQF